MPRTCIPGDLPHMFAGIGKLAPQEFRLNLDGLLKIGGMNQLARMIECGLHVLLGEGERLSGRFPVPGPDTDVTDLFAASKNIPNAFSA